jgi:predicted DNA-binding transcriptional regulator AlpA
MSNSSSELPPRLLRTPEAARYLGLSGRTLEKHRTYGTGPAYLKLGGRVVYAIDDLNSWAGQGLRHSTSDPGNGIVHPAKRRDAPVLTNERASVNSGNQRDTKSSSLVRGANVRSDGQSTSGSNAGSAPNRR